MSDVGIAVALCYLPDEDRTMHTEYRTEGEFAQANPILAAKALVKSCKDDFPNGLWTVTGNDRAKEIELKARLEGLGLE